MKQIESLGTDSSGSPLLPYPYKQILIAFIIVKYLWEQYLNYRQIQRHMIRNIPQDLNQYNSLNQGFILSQSYHFDKMAYQMLSLSIKTGVDCMCIMCNVWPFIWDNIDQIIWFVDMGSETQRAIGYVLIQCFIRQAFNVPFSAYETFIIQKKYAFTNKTINLWDFIKDLFINGLFTVFIIPSVLIGYLRVVQYGGEYFYWFLQIFSLFVTILLNFIHPNLIAPLFNQFKPLANTVVISQLNHLAEKVKFPLKNIKSIDDNSMAAHSNAYFYGFGRTKVIVLHRTLFRKLNNREITSVVCHEMGHWAYSHPFKKLFVYLMEVWSIFYIFSFFLQNQEVFISFGFKEKSIFIGSVMVYHLFEPLTSIFTILLLVLNRKFEFEADLFACQNGYGQELKNSLIRLSEGSINMVKPDWLYAWLKHSHPTVHQRVQKIEEFEEEHRAIQEQWDSSSNSSSKSSKEE